jgi:mRNA interferase MazF
MKRGEIWTLRDKNYAGKSRPSVIIQELTDHIFDSIVLCLMTTYDSELIKNRVKIEPTKGNGLKKTTFVMTEKIVTVNKELLGEYVGTLTEKQMHEISKQLAKILEIHKEDID